MKQQIFLIFLFWILLHSMEVFGMKKVRLLSYASSGHDVTETLQKLIDEYDEIIIDQGIWIVSKPIYLRSHVTIRGTNKNKCIIQACEKTLLEGETHFAIFTTVRVNHPLGIVRCHSLEDNEYGKGVKTNIIIKNLTFDLNKHPETFEKENRSLLKAEVCAIWLENCKDCIISNCYFIDWANSERGVIHRFNNGIAAIFIVKGTDCVVSKSFSRKCTFLAVLDSKNCTISGNKGENSIGSWIETLGGGGHRILRNRLSNVEWKVSSIGINSKSCEIGHNIVDNRIGGETSILTLGHDIKDPGALGYYNMTTSADSAFVHDNNFVTQGHRGILVMNASNITIIKNHISVHKVAGINENTEAIVLAGTIPNFSKQKILNNTLNVDGEGTGYGILGYYLDDSIIKGNVINADCEYAIDIHTRTTTVSIINNKISNKGKYIVMARNVDYISLQNNTFYGGAVKITSGAFVFNNNKWNNIQNISVISLNESAKLMTSQIINNRFSTGMFFPNRSLFMVNSDSTILNIENNKITSKSNNKIEYNVL